MTTVSILSPSFSEPFVVVPVEVQGSGDTEPALGFSIKENTGEWVPWVGDFVGFGADADSVFVAYVEVDLQVDTAVGIRHLDSDVPFIEFGLRLVAEDVRIEIARFEI